MKFGVVNKSTTVNRFVLHTLQRNITHLAVITRKSNIKLDILKGGKTGKEPKNCECGRIFLCSLHSNRLLLHKLYSVCFPFCIFVRSKGRLFLLPPPPPPPANFSRKFVDHIVRLLRKFTYGLIRPRQTYLGSFPVSICSPRQISLHYDNVK